MKKGKVESNNFFKCMFCDRESYQAGRFISTNMNLVQIMCKEHFIQLLDCQERVSVSQLHETPEEGLEDE
jgi:hypothetical protein